MSISGEQEPVLLLRTKLHMPRTRDDLVARPRLTDRLNRGLDRRLTLVCAPAGYGKTTLLAQWLAGSPRPVVWLSLNESDNDLVLFLSYFIAAIQGLFPEACPETSSLLKAVQLPPQDYLETTLINEINQLPEPFILVLDDYHWIEDQGVHQLLTALATSRLQSMHLVLASRAEPPLPFARLRVGRKMEELRMEDLRFTLDEAQAFLYAALDMTLSDDAVGALEERTEGWIAGLRLAALSLRRHAYPGDFVHQFKGKQRELADYLMAEVLAHQSVEVQNYLLRTSILDRFCASLGDAVCFGGTETPAATASLPTLEELDRRNLFLVPLDHEHRWYRYHPLFQEMLHHQLRLQMSEHEIAALHRKASAWFAERGYTDAALHHALRAGDILEAARLVEASRFDVLSRGDWRTLERRFNRLPEEATWLRPGLLVVQAWTLWYQFRLRDIESLLDEAASRLDHSETTYSEAEQTTLRGEIDTLRCYTSRLLRDDIQHSLECAERALKQLPTAHVAARGVALAFLCLDYQAVGRSDDALRPLTKASGDLLHDSAYRMQAFISLCFVHFLSGELNQAHQTAMRFLEVAIAEEQVPNIGWAHYWMGLVNYEWNDLDAAAQHFSAVADKRYRASFITVLGGMRFLAQAHLAHGRPDKAQESLTTLREHFVKVTGAPSSPDIDALQALLALTQGDQASAVQWARSFDPLAVKEAFNVLQPPSLARERILIAQGTTAGLQEAVRDLQKLLSAAEEVYNIRRVIQVLAHLALAYDAQGQEQDALQALERAVRLARPGGFIRTFVDLGPEMAKLLYRLAEQGVAPDYVGHVLAAFSGLRIDDAPGYWQRPTTTAPSESKVRQPSAVHGPSSSFVDPLTRRELEVLELLNEELTNHEISRALVISPLTVKRHASNIYAKLGVSGRRRAAAQAKTLGILPRD